MTKRVLITCPPALATPARYIERLGAAGIDVVLADVVQQLSEDELIALMTDVDAIIAGDDPLTRRVMTACPRVRLIARWGVGIDNVDLEAAAALGVRVTNTPSVFGDEVADVAIGYVILLARHLHTIDRAVRDGGWAKPRGHSLGGRTIGILGLGSIGRAVACRAIAMKMRAIGYDVSADARANATAVGVELVELDRLMTESEVLVLCSSLTAGSRHIVNESTLARMPAGAWLVNVSRGALVDESALVAALVDGRLGGAALDVFESEPLPSSSALRGLDQVILGSHNGSNTEEAVARVNEIVIEQVLSGLAEMTE
jgi:D-3-phosphoglycerate dehydrogenase